MLTIALSWPIGQQKKYARKRPAFTRINLARCQCPSEKQPASALLLTHPSNPPSFRDNTSASILSAHPSTPPSFADNTSANIPSPRPSIHPAFLQRQHTSKRLFSSHMLPPRLPSETTHQQAPLLLTHASNPPSFADNTSASIPSPGPSIQPILHRTPAKPSPLSSIQPGPAALKYHFQRMVF